MIAKAAAIYSEGPALTRERRALWPCPKHGDDEVPRVSPSVAYKQSGGKHTLLMQCSLCGEPWEI